MEHNIPEEQSSSSTREWEERTGLHGRVLEITSPADITAILNSIRWWNRREGEIRIVAPLLSRDESAVREKELNKNYRACGCGIAGIFTIGALLLLAVHWSQTTRSFGALEIGLYAAVVLASGLAGKLTGLGIGFFRLRRDLKRLASTLGGTSLREIPEGMS